MIVDFWFWFANAAFKPFDKAFIELVIKLLVEFTLNFYDFVVNVDLFLLDHLVVSGKGLSTSCIL